MLAFVERLAERDELDLDACGEFLVLISALLELKARALFPDEDAELAELEPEQAAEELARRLAEYRRAKEGAAWLAERLERGARPLLPPRPGAARAGAARAAFASQEPESARRRCCGCSRSSRPRCRPRTWRCASRRSRSSSSAGASLLRRRVADRLRPGGRGPVARIEVAVAFLALLELSKQGELELAQAAPFAPIRISRPDVERRTSWNVRSA